MSGLPDLVDLLEPVLGGFGAEQVGVALILVTLALWLWRGRRFGRVLVSVFGTIAQNALVVVVLLAAFALFGWVAVQPGDMTADLAAAMSRLPIGDLVEQAKGVLP